MAQSSTPGRSKKLAASTVKAIAGLSDIQKAIREARRSSSQGILSRRPPGSFTLSEFVAETGMPVGTASGLLRRLVIQRKYEKFRVYLADGNARLRAMNVYRKKGKA